MMSTVLMMVFYPLALIYLTDIQGVNFWLALIPVELYLLDMDVKLSQLRQFGIRQNTMNRHLLVEIASCKANTDMTNQEEPKAPPNIEFSESGVPKPLTADYTEKVDNSIFGLMTFLIIFIALLLLSVFGG